MTNYYLQKLSSAAAEAGHRLSVIFADGYSATIDLRPWIDRAPLRAPLLDRAVFERVVVNEFGAPEWPEEIDLSPGTLRAWCEAGRVMTKNETDNWIAERTRAAQEVA